MRASWKRLVQVAIVVFLLWVSFNVFLFYWKNRKGPSNVITMDMPRLRHPHHPLTHLIGKAAYPLQKWLSLSTSYRQMKSEDLVWQKWISENQAAATSFCGGRFDGYMGQFAYLRNIIIDKTYAEGRPGGEEIKSVLNQPEHHEFYKFHPGFFKMVCDSPFQYSFRIGHRNHINAYMQSMSFTSRKKDSTIPLFAANKTVFVVTRYEYVNIYHSMTDFYNAFLQMTFFGLKPQNILVLLADGHPKGSLDSVWSTLFDSYVRLGNLKEKVFVRDMVWVQLSYLSPLIAHSLPKIPATEAFRDFFLRRYNISGINRALNCSHIRVLLILRRDYLAHPRNPSGHVVRKIKNEAEIVSEVRHEIPAARVRAEQIDLFSLSHQLQMIADTDILVGMHGAGLTHSLFLPRHGGLVEMYPTYWSEGNVHFKKIALWRQLHYQRWVNHNPRLEYANHYTRIPPGVVSSMIRQVLHGMKCSKHHAH